MSERSDHTLLAADPGSVIHPTKPTVRFAAIPAVQPRLITGCVRRGADADIVLFVIDATIVWSAGSVVPETSPQIYCPRPDVTVLSSLL